MATQYLYSLTSSWTSGVDKSIQLIANNASAASVLSSLIDLQTDQRGQVFTVYKDGTIILGNKNTNFVSPNKDGSMLYNLIQGSTNYISGSYNFAFGSGNRTINNHSFNFIGGFQNISTGSTFNWISGRANIISRSFYAGVFGDTCTLRNAYASFTTGRDNLNNASGSHVEGRLNSTYGLYSHAEGYSTTAYGDYSHSDGGFTIASGSYQTVVGQYNNKGNTTSYFVVGTGTGAGNRVDGLSVAPNVVAITGSIKVKGAFISASTNVIATAGAITTYIPVVVNGTKYKMPLYAW